jgi:vinculin
LFSFTKIHGVYSEEGILRDTDRTEQAIANTDAAGIVNNTSSIARRAHRILQVAQSEADNSEDPLFVDRVNETVNQLRNS